MSEIGEALKRAAGKLNSKASANFIVKGFAKDIDETKGVFTLELGDDEADLPEVSLNAFFEDKGYFIIIPKANSAVIVSFVNGKKDAFLIQASQIEKIKCKVGDFELTLDKDQLHSKISDSELTQTKESTKIKKGTSEMELKGEGLSVKRNGEDLKSCLNDFMDECMKIIVVVGTTINVGAVTAIKLRLNKVLC